MNTVYLLVLFNALLFYVVMNSQELSNQLEITEVVDFSKVINFNMGVRYTLHSIHNTV